MAYGVQARELIFPVVKCAAYGIVPEQTLGESGQEAAYEVIA